MRIASLVPSATEMLFALGLGDSVVAVTHECDFPAEAAAKPHLTRTAVAPGLSAAEIDAEVKRIRGEGRPLYDLDEGRLAELAPELIVTQAVCEVCAVSFDDVLAVAARLPSHPGVLSLDPSTLEEVLDDVLRLGEATGSGEAAGTLRADLDRRLQETRAAVAPAERPRVLTLEWLDPPFVGGHWVPQMIEAAGGTDIAGRPGERSRQASWEELAGAGPDVIVAMPCGWNARTARREALAHLDELAGVDPGRIVAVDAAASFSRPGPRLVDGVELLGHIFHPDLVDPVPGATWEEVEAGAWA